MMISYRTSSIRLGFAALVFLSVPSLGAQELAPAAKPTAPAQPTAAPKRTYDASRRVPAHFGEIGLSTEQRESIYKVRASRRQKIVELEKQIAQLKAEMMAESEAVLTDAQKQLLEHRRHAALESRKGQEGAKLPKQSAK